MALGGVPLGSHDFTLPELDQRIRSKTTGTTIILEGVVRRTYELIIKKNGV